MLIDLFQLSPTPAEEEVISLLLGELLTQVPRFANDRLNFTDILPTTDPSTGGLYRNTCPTDPSKGDKTCQFIGPNVVGKRSTINGMRIKILIVIVNVFFTVIECARRAARSCNGIVRSIGDYFLSLIPRT